MKRNYQKVPRFDEIIFENRNKSYGAYDLRKRYKSTACFSLFGGVVLFTIPVILAFVFSPEPAIAKSDQEIYVAVKTDNLPDPSKIAPPEPLKQEPVPPKYSYSVPTVVDDTSAVTDFMINDFAKDFVVNGLVIETTDSLIYSNPTIEIAEEPEPLTFVQEPPMFPGGEGALLKFIADNTIYPAEAIDNNIEGKVFVRFAVSADGTVKRIQLMRSVNPLLDAEALRVVSTLPAWKPGRQNGRTVPVWYYVPVTFRIQRN
jgi:periplasmic protein TonB